MNKISSLQRMSRHCLLFFTLLSCMFMEENAFSNKFWMKDNLTLTYDPLYRTLTFDYLIYDYGIANSNDFSFLRYSDFFYSDENENDIFLISIETLEQKSLDRTCLSIKNKRKGEKIQFLNCVEPKKVIICPDYIKDLLIIINIKNFKNLVDPRENGYKRSYLRFMWCLPPSSKYIKNIRIRGNWTNENDKAAQVLNFVYDMKQEVLIKPANLKNSPNALKPVLCNKLSKAVKMSKSL